jgi:N-acetylglutamate synthase-like GNAT family acetyltransferase
MKYIISSDKAHLQIEVIHQFLSQCYWSKNIPLHTLTKAIEHSLCFGVYLTENDQMQQVGFARLITDHATFAYLADVFILKDHRGKGLSKKLISSIVEHPDTQGLRRIVLATADAHGLYSQYGFTSLNTPNIFMEIWQPTVYQSQT